MVLFCMALLFLSMFVFSNSLYYTIILLIVASIFLFSLVVNTCISTLTILMLLIVYLGAMMILIGYICAVCPNLVLSPSVYGLKTVSVVVFLFFLFLPKTGIFMFNNDFLLLSGYFFNIPGLVVFSCVVFILFITLLIVTSQYLTPNGPFRSISV